MDSLSRAFWFTIGSGFIVAWLAIIFALGEGSGSTTGEIGLAAGGLTLGLMAIAMARLLSRED